MRILQVMDNLQVGGIQSFIMNVYRNIDREKFQFDFLIFRNDEQHFEKEINSYGGEVFRIPGRRDGLIQHIKALKDFFSSHPEYTVIHYHTSSASNIYPIIYAKKCGATKVIIHSHNTHQSGNVLHAALHKINKKRIASYANIYLACGMKAGKWLYGGTKCDDKFIIINNGVNLSKYKYSQEKRNNIRKELDVNNKTLVIGHVGRFSEAKNQAFLIDILEEILKIQHNVKLVLVGDGPNRADVFNYAKSKNLLKYVTFLGNRDDVDSILQGFDIFVMPSLFEGFPVSAIEAEAAGLPCILSTNISKEVVLKNNVIQLSLDDSKDTWANNVLNNKERIIDNEILYKNGFDINNTVEKLESIYQD